MSFILDALRKSEDERREQSAPTLASAPRAVAAKKRSLWLPVIAVVLAINALVLGAWLIKREAAAPSLPASAVPAASTDPPATAAPAPQPAAPVTEILADQEPEPRKPATTVSAAPPAPARAIQEGLPTLEQLRAANLISVPSLRVDMHVYSADARKRFVFINMSKYREGDRLAEGPLVEEITPEGVILSAEERRFHLDRD